MKNIHEAPTDPTPTPDPRQQLADIVERVLALDAEALDNFAAAIDHKRSTEIHKSNRHQPSATHEQIVEWARLTFILDCLLTLHHDMAAFEDLPALLRDSDESEETNDDVK